MLLLFNMQSKWGKNAQINHSKQPPESCQIENRNCPEILKVIFRTNLTAESLCVLLERRRVHPWTQGPWCITDNYS